MLALLLAVQTAPVPSAEVAEDIVVIGRKLQNWRASFRVKKGTYACKVTRSTGDADIDRLGCEAMQACLVPAMPRYDATRAKGIDAAPRKRMTAAINAEMATCVGDRRQALILKLADRRAGGGA